MSNRNASPSAFGWDFQVNSAIVLMLENIKEAKRVRVEGSDEDIEIALNNQEKIYAQAKAVVNPDDYSYLVDKLTKALETLSDAAKREDGSLFTYITNSPNPFNNQRIMSYFTGRTHLYYDELPKAAQKKIDNLISANGYATLDVNKFDMRVIPFYGNDLKNRYKEIRAYIDDFLAELNVNSPGINSKVMDFWQRELFQNATQTDTSISISKEEMIWPLIVLVVDETAANVYKTDFDDDEIDEIEHKYKLIINQETLRYEIISRVLSDYRVSNKSTKQFVADHWPDYLDIVGTIEADDSTKESLVKIILYRIIMKRQTIRSIKRGVNL